MPTVSQAIATIKPVIEAALPVNPETGQQVSLTVHGDRRMELPDTPTPFVFVTFQTERARVIENGGGLGSNRHRQRLTALILIFLPLGWKCTRGTDYAEAFALPFRAFQQDGVTIEDVTVDPGGPGSEIALPGIDNAAVDYFWSGCEANFHFDLIG